MSGYLIIFLYWVILAALFVYITKKNFSIMISFSMMLTGLITTILAILIDNIRISFVLCNFIYVIIFIFYLVRDKKIGIVNDNIKIFKDNFFEASLLVFLVLYIAIIIIHSNSNITTFDEITFWSPITREMYFENRLHFHLLSRFSGSIEYPPFFQIIELIFLFLYRGGFKENIVYFALSIFTVSVFIVAFNGKNKKHIITYSMLFIGCFILLNLSNYVIEHSSYDKFTSIFESIQLDQMIGLIPSLGLFWILKKDDFELFDKFYLFLVMSVIGLTKQISPAFLLMTMVYYFAKKIYFKKRMHYSDLLLLLPILVWLFWRVSSQAYIASEMVDVINNSFSNISSGLSNVFIKDTEFYNIVTNNYLNALLFSPIINAHGLKLTYFLINIIICILVYLLIRYTDSYNRKNSILLLIIYAIGFIGYAFTIYVLYLKVFTPEEAILTASFERFMGSYVYLGLNLLTMIAMNVMIKNKNISAVLLLLFVLSCEYNINLLNPNNRYNFKKDYKFNELSNQYSEYLHKDDKLLIINNKYQPFLSYYLRYDKDNVKASISTREDYSIDFTNYENAIKYFEDYDYIYIYNYNPAFYELFWDGNQDEYLLTDRLYTIKNGKFELVPWTPSQN